MRIRKKKNSVTADFEKFLKDYNCQYDIEHEDNATIYNFEFQAARFVAAIRKQDDCVEVTFPTMSSFPIAQLDLVRAKCNERNNSNILFKYSYSIDHETNKVDVHMSFFNNKVESEDLVHELKAAFHFQREWHKDLDEAVAIARDSDSMDLESELYKHQREMFMLRRLELKHQLDSSAASFAVGVGPLPLWQMLQTVMPLPQSTLLFMTVNTVDGQRRLENDEAIRLFNLRHALVEGDGEKARLTRDYALLDLHYKQGQDEQPRLLTIALTAEGEDKHSIYTRVTVTQVPRNASRMNSLSNEGRQPHSVSMLIALDRSNDKRYQQC